MLTEVPVPADRFTPAIDGGARRWVTEEDVAELVSLPDAITAIRSAYRRAAAGEIVAMPKTFASWDGGTMHAIGAATCSNGLAVAKTWTHTRGGATPLLIAWDVSTGELLAVVEAFTLGQLRTSAVSGAATALLAVEPCNAVAVIGSGKQAEGQVAAVAAVRNIGEIRVYSPTAEHRERFAARVAERSLIPTRVVGSVGDTVDGADVIVTVTRATQPFLERPMLARRVHINAVGAITPDRAEVGALIVASARRVVADDVVAARELSPREMSSAPHILSLATLLASAEQLEGDGITIFKALGSGISDFAVAELVIARAAAAGVGKPLPPYRRSQPTIWSS